MRWVWLDRFEEFHSRKSARAVKVVSFAEDHIHEQYSEYPIYPHSLIIEGVAQTGGILVGEANDFAEKVVLAKIPKATFFGHAVPGDKLEYSVDLLDLRDQGAVVAAKVSRNGEPFAEMEIVYAHLDQAMSDPVGAKNFVFTKDHLIALLKLADGSYRPAEGSAGSDGKGSPEGRE